jgi:hypothetical protein
MGIPYDERVPVKQLVKTGDLVVVNVSARASVMADDDDWETDADFENNMTEQEKRKAGNPELLAQKQQEAASGMMTMEAVRSKALAASEVPLDQKDRRDGYQKPGEDQTTTKEAQKSA